MVSLAVFITGERRCFARLTWFLRRFHNTCARQAMAVHFYVVFSTTSDGNADAGAVGGVLKAALPSRAYTSVTISQNVKGLAKFAAANSHGRDHLVAWYTEFAHFYPSSSYHHQYTKLAIAYSHAELRGHTHYVRIRTDWISNDFLKLTRAAFEQCNTPLLCHDVFAAGPWSTARAYCLCLDELVKDAKQRRAGIRRAGGKRINPALSQLIHATSPNIAVGGNYVGNLCVANVDTHPLYAKGIIVRFSKHHDCLYVRGLNVPQTVTDILACSPVTIHMLAIKPHTTTCMHREEECALNRAVRSPHPHHSHH